MVVAIATLYNIWYACYWHTVCTLRGVGRALRPALAGCPNLQGKTQWALGVCTMVTNVQQLQAALLFAKQQQAALQAALQQAASKQQARAGRKLQAALQQATALQGQGATGQAMAQYYTSKAACLQGQGKGKQQGQAALQQGQAASQQGQAIVAWLQTLPMGATYTVQQLQAMRGCKGTPIRKALQALGVQPVNGRYSYTR